MEQNLCRRRTNVAGQAVRRRDDQLRKLFIEELCQLLQPLGVASLRSNNKKRSEFEIHTNCKRRAEPAAVATIDPAKRAPQPKPHDVATRCGGSSNSNGSSTSVGATQAANGNMSGSSSNNRGLLSIKKSPKRNNCGKCENLRGQHMRFMCVSTTNAKIIVSHCITTAAAVTGAAATATTWPKRKLSFHLDAATIHQQLRIKQRIKQKTKAATDNKHTEKQKIYPSHPSPTISTPK